MPYNSPISTRTSYDSSTDSVVQRRQQDVEPLLELNRRELNGDLPTGRATFGGMHKAASIPLIVIEKWKAELGIDALNKSHFHKVKQLLNDPEWKYLRTSEGRL